MKICLIGKFSGPLDEGMRNTCSYLSKELRKNNSLLILNLKDIYEIDYWIQLKKFKPHIIHYLHGPSLKSLIILKFISYYMPDSKMIVSAMHPRFNSISKKCIPLFKPDIVLTQSDRSTKMFKDLGCECNFLHCGVDIKRFHPIILNEKRELRRKHGLDLDKYIVLHVGSLKEGRNINIFERIQSDNCQVVIIGAMSNGVDQNLYMRLLSAGCIIITKYQENIEEFYALSDCYVFPTIMQMDKFERMHSDSIEMPLSVLEAMACNLSVISTKFCDLDKIFQQGDGLFFVDNHKQIVDILNIIRTNNNNSIINTRQKVEAYSWERIGKHLRTIYSKAIEVG